MLKGSDMTLLSIKMNFIAPVKCNILTVQACGLVITVIPNGHHAL